MTTLVTGGAGYIGGHVVSALMQAGEPVFVIDNLSSGQRATLPPEVPLAVGDCGDTQLVAAVIRDHGVSAVIHLAAPGSVTGPGRDPDGLYRGPIATRNLLEAAANNGVRHIVLASTAAVYGDSDQLLISEDAPARPLSPAAWSRLMSETVLQGLAAAHGLAYVILRPFSVAGSDPGLHPDLACGHGEALVRVAVEAALGIRSHLDVYGTTHPTPDGTALRDYVHVGDVARAHVAALRYLRAGGASATFNCGSGRGHSVRDTVATVEHACAHPVPVRYVGPRPGDPARLVADSRRIRAALAWAPRFDTLETIAAHTRDWVLDRQARQQEATDAFAKIVAVSGVPAPRLQRLLAGFGSRSGPALREPATVRTPAPVSSLPAPPILATPRADQARTLTIGMTTDDDYDGVYFTLQAIRLHHPEILDDVEFIVVDHNAVGPCSRALKEIEALIPNYRYIPEGGCSGMAARDRLFQEASGDFVLCLDSHVLLMPEALTRLLAYVRANPATPDLLQGPMVHADLTTCSTHFTPGWQAGAYGIRDAEPAGADVGLAPFEIPMQGLGLLACRRDAWPGLNPAFRGFGGEEGYLHEKFRQRGGRVLCLPFLRWTPRPRRPLGSPRASGWDDRVRNYLIGFRELGWDTAPIVDHFKAFLGAPVWSVIAAQLGPELVPADEAGAPATWRNATEETPPC
ncbi:MAG: UDP-glucose 4-epimerase GalE [Xanthobacteraceae bacterium]|nr:UDP-glucose 4-epimerase GalE [Xanthobacteraceae bacterium]